MNGFVRRMRVPLVAAALAAIAGCRSHTTPSDPMVGTWRGTIEDQVKGTGIAELTIETRKGPGVLGVWSATFDAGGTAGGTLSGTTQSENAAALSLAWEPRAPCGFTSPLALNATFDGPTLSGTYVIITCTGLTTGSISATRVP